MKNIYRAGSLMLLLLLIFSTVAFAQERSGELNGSAMDQSNAVLPNVTVTATNLASGRTITTKTGGDGHFVLRPVDPGRYSVKFELQGFATQEYADVVVGAGRVLTLNGDLKVSGTQQSVEVTGAAPLIDMTTTSVGHNVTAEEFDSLPKTRSFQSLANVSPSVSAGTVTEGGIQINGASGAENQFAVDGISTNSLIEGGSRQNAAFEILEEVQVKTAGTEAQYGGALGGVISAITKSGGNTFHGDLHYYGSGSALNAGLAKRMLMDASDQVTITMQRDHDDPSTTKEVGYSLGGYFIKNRLYFFSAASPQFVDRKQHVLASDKTPVDLTSKDRYWQGYNKLSADITRNLRLTAGFLWSPSSEAGILVGTTSYANQSTSGAASILANQARGWFSPQSNYNLTLDWTATPTTLFTFKAARFWDNYKALGVINQSAIEWGVPSVGIVGLDASLQQPKGYTTIPRTTTTLYDLATRNVLQADLSKFVSFAGQHDFKFGYGRQKNVNKVIKAYPGGGYVTINWNSQLTLPNGSKVSGKYGYYQVDDQGTIGSTGGTIDDLYFQDRWRIGKRLSLDIGLRLEKEVIPSFRRDIKPYAFEFGWGSKVAPRVGGSFDVFGDGKMKVYGSWGRYYDWVKYELARGTFGGDTWRTYYRSLDSLDKSYILGLSGTNMPGTNLWVNAFQDWRVPAFGSDSVDPNIRPMSSWLGNAGVEYQVGPKVMVALRYTHNSLRTTIEDIGTMIDGSEVYIYGNPGEGLAKMTSPATKTPSMEIPKPKRVYDALELSFSRRFANRWFASGSYVLSRLWGDYAGLQNSDEITPRSLGTSSANAQQSAGTAYRPGSSATRAYDLDYYMWDSKGNYDLTGRLGSDRPNALKLYGSYMIPSKLGETQIGLNFRVTSGVPMSTWVMDTQRIPLFVNGRGDMGRSPVMSNTDLLLTHEVKFGESSKVLHFEFNAQNLFNQSIAQYVYPYYNRYRVASSAISMSAVDLKAGYNWQSMVAGTQDATKTWGAKDPRFGKPDSFSTGFQGRFGIKFQF